jgi:hypothetical protein
MGVGWSGVSSCRAQFRIWPIFREIYCMAPILATHPQGPIGQFLGPNRFLGLIVMTRY